MRRAALLALAGCASFDPPSIIVDLRVIAMTMEPGPERVVDLDLRTGARPSIDDVIAALEAQPLPRVCAIVADPATASDLRYSMSACMLADDGRCDPTRRRIMLASEQTLYDPEVWIGVAAPACVDVPVDRGLVEMLYAAIEERPELAWLGVDYAVELRIGRVDMHPASDAFASKRGRIAARIPETREANANPDVELEIAKGGVVLGDGTPRPCAQPYGELVEVRAGERIDLAPLEADDARELFETPTLDGQFVTSIEFLSYQWLSTRGAFSHDYTGGSPDLSGNFVQLATTWTAPETDELDGPTDVPIWMVARDGRLGTTVRETCLRVVP